MPQENTALSDVPPKDIAKIDGSPSTLVLGILSIALSIIPLVGLVLGAVGAIKGTLKLRKFQYTKDGNRIVTFTPWYRVPASVKVGVILSYVGILTGAFSTVIGGIIIIITLTNVH